MKTITINVPDDCEVQIVKKEEKKYEFKKGDVIVSKFGSIAIFEKIDRNPETGNIVVFFSTLYKDNELKFINKVGCGIGYEEECRLANKEEINTLIYALKEEVSKGNKNAIKVLKEVFNIEVSPKIRTYQDLIDNRVSIEGAWIDNKAHIQSYNAIIAQKDFTEDIAKSEKVAKSMLAMAMISQLMPYYGGEITNEEWENNSVEKFTICKMEGRIENNISYCLASYLAFHTAKQRDEFLKYNEQLIKDYLMID